MRSSARTLFGACVALLAGAAVAQQPVAAGYTDGGLALAAMERGDWASAERQLDQLGTVAPDAAQLINLGEVYYRTGRTARAFQTWEAAAAAQEPVLVQTRDGRIVSTADLARQALRRRTYAAR